MAEVLLFHHALGLTPGVRSFADDLRADGHTVDAPDLFEGRTFTDVDAGVAHARDDIGFDTLIDRGRQAAEELPVDLVYGGFSLGAAPAQELIQTRPGARGALFFHAAMSPEEFGGAWPNGLPVQFHVMEDDALGDVDVARELVSRIERAELFLYPGDRHLFTDESTADYDEAATALVKQRVLDFLGSLG